MTNTPLAGVDTGERPSARQTRVDPPTALALAEALEREGRYADAGEIYRRLLEQLPGDAGLLHNLGLAHRRLGDLAAAERQIREAIRIDPSKAVFHNSLGAILRQANRLGEAENCYRQALTVWEAYAEARYNLGLLLESTGRLDEAIECQRLTLAYQPAYVRARSRLGVLLHRRGDLLAAHEVLAAAAAAEPTLFEAQYYLGWVLADQGRHDEALAALRRAQALRPDSFEVEQALANTLRDAGQHEAALDQYWRLLELRPERAATHEELNKLAWASGRRDLYLQSFEHARARRGEDPELLAMQAAFHLRQEDYAAAEALVQRARALAPGRHELAGLLARAVAGQGRADESYRWFMEAISREPEVMLHRQELAFTLLRAGQAPEALEVLTRALQIAPDDQLLLAGLTLALRELGDERLAQWVDYRTDVGVYDLAGAPGSEEALHFNQTLAQELDALHRSKAEPVDQTLRGGTQTFGRLFDAQTPAIRQLKTRFDAAVADYLGRRPDRPEHPVNRRRTGGFDYSGSWSCRLASGGFHRNHVHPRGWLSSAYYVRLPDLDRQDAPQAGWLKFGESGLGLGVRDQAEHLIRPAVGRLVLFPSYFWHGTVPFQDEGDRLTVAFDVLPRA